MKKLINKKTISLFLLLLSLIIWCVLSFVKYDRLLEAQIEDEEIIFNDITRDFSHQLDSAMAYIVSVRGFVYSQIDNDISKDEFDRFSDEIQNHNYFIKNFSIAPNNIQTYVFPLEGNEITLGHNLETDERENVRLDVQNAMSSGNNIISGPYTLRQGGLGMIIRNPIYKDDQYWGLINVVVDVDALINSSNLGTIEVPFNISISNEDEIIFWSNNDQNKFNITYDLPFADSKWIIKGHINNQLNKGNIISFIKTILLYILFILLIAIIFQRILFTNFLLSSDIKKLVYNDPLTSLPNRRALDQRLNQLIKKEIMFSLAFIDLDNFKNINDSRGHSIGDGILNSIASRLREINQFEYFRWGGDEFVSLFINSEAHEALNNLTNIVTRINEPLLINDETYVIRCSAGISTFPNHGASVDDIMKLADASMYIAKMEGKNKIKIYTEDIGINLSHIYHIERDLEKALKESKLQVYYQPQYNLSTGKFECVEALIRWWDDLGNFIPPNVFIPIAERSNLINTLDEYVLTNVIIQIATWKKQGIHMKVAANISANHFTTKLTSFIIKTLTQYDVSPDMLEIEITETAAVFDFASTKQTIDALRHLGIDIALDDFGTGYSSLSYLSRLNISTLKIDIEFISKITSYSSEFSIVKSIINIAKALKIKTVAEGVETKEQLAILSDLGCDLCQGYFFSKAVPSEDIEKQITNTLL